MMTFDELPADNNLIFREGDTSPSALRPRPQDEGKLSFRSSLSNPVDSQARPVFREGEPFFAVDINLLPAGSVIFDNAPPGHVSVENVPAPVIKAAVVGRGKIREGG